MYCARRVFISFNQTGSSSPAASTSPAPTDGERQEGQSRYGALCASCHGARGEGGTAPALRPSGARDEAMAGIEDGTDRGPLDGAGVRPAGVPRALWSPDAMAPFGPLPVPPHRWVESKGIGARVFILSAGVLMNILLTQEGDLKKFRQVYPFSPALVQTLIAVSSVLQRERTALKVMLQLLVDQRDTLKVGDVVPVGDLFDAIAQGDEAFSEGMRIHFDHAKQLYHRKLLPMLERAHSLTREELRAMRGQGGHAGKDVAAAAQSDHVADQVAAVHRHQG